MSIFARFSYSLSNKLALSPVASAVTAIHRDRVVLASYAPWSEMQPLVPRGQIVSGDLPLLTGRRVTDTILIIIIILTQE